MNPFRGWIKLTIRGVPKPIPTNCKHGIKSTMMANLTMIFISLTILIFSLVLYSAFSKWKDALGYPFSFLMLVLYYHLLNRIHRIVKFNRRMSEKDNDTRQE